MLPAEINDTITKYWDAFNANDLDCVMTCFSDEAVYQPGDGRTHKGRAEIWAAFEPQFNGALGAMRFDEHDRVVDSRESQDRAPMGMPTRHFACQAERAGLDPPEIYHTLGHRKQVRVAGPRCIPFRRRWQDQG